jgi:hypothetical protein
MVTPRLPPSPGLPNVSNWPLTRGLMPSTSLTAPEQSTGTACLSAATLPPWPPPHWYGRCRASTAFARWVIRFTYGPDAGAVGPALVGLAPGAVDCRTVRVAGVSCAPWMPDANASVAPELFTPPCCRKFATSCWRMTLLSTPGVVVTVRVVVLGVLVLGTRGVVVARLRPSLQPPRLPSRTPASPGTAARRGNARRRPGRRCTPRAPWRRCRRSGRAAGVGTSRRPPGSAGGRTG